MRLSGITVKNYKGSMLSNLIAKVVKSDKNYSALETLFMGIRKGKIGHSRLGIFYFVKEEKERSIVEIRGFEPYFEMELIYT